MNKSAIKRVVRKNFPRLYRLLHNSLRNLIINLDIKMISFLYYFRVKNLNKNRRCILIIGMHRSGTSLMAGLLKILGINLGDKLLSEHPTNPKGFFENKRILIINEKILKKLNSSWDDTDFLPKNWQDYKSIKPFKERIKYTLLTEFRSSNIFGIKEPRITILLPLYLEIFKKLKIEPHFIIMKRNKKEIIKSLQKREGFSNEKCNALIDKYWRNAEEYTKRYKGVAINFDDLINSPKETIEKVEKNLNVSFNNYESVKDKIEDFIDPKLKHHNELKK